MSKAKAKSTSNRKVSRILVVYGFDEEKKPRAAKFPESEFDLARKAADLMKLTVFEGDTRKLRRTLKNLPTGNIYASGWAFVPNVRRTQFDALVTKLTSIKSETSESVGHIGLPVSWATIVEGELILAQADSASDGWWPVTVVDVEGDMLVLQARDYPKAPKVVRQRSAVALFYTADFVTPKDTDSRAPGLPVSWNTLAPDQIVIAQDAKPENGWWEAEIVKVHRDELTLRWRDYPRLPVQKRLRTEVALLNPCPTQAS